MIWMSRFTLFLAVGGLFCLAVLYPDLPEQLPSHFGISGKADAWEDKGSIWFFEAIGIGVYLLLTFVLRLPGSWNTGITVTEENKEWVYQSLAKALVTMRFLQVCLFWYITWGIVRSQDLDGAILFLLILGMLAPLLVYLLQCRKYKKIK